MSQKRDITKEQLQELIDKSLTRKEIAKELKKSLSYVVKYLQFFGLKTSQSLISRTCKECGKTLTGKQQFYCSNNCKCLYFYKNNKNKKQPNELGCHYQTYRGKLKKIKLIKLLGGKCLKCGYNSNYAALNFHHKEITSKLFNLDVRTISSKNMKLLEVEAYKCILLCANCHMEEHHPHCLL